MKVHTGSELKRTIFRENGLFPLPARLINWIKLGGRLTVRLRPLEPRIGVRIPASQPLRTANSMRFYPFLLLVAPLACLAQVPGAATAPLAAPMPAAPPQAPPEVDQALRARANAFLDSQSKGDFRKAYDLVAEDSKDYYFGATKEKAASFTIDDIQYGAGLSTATVRSTMKREMMLAGHAVEVPQMLVSEWKLEKEEWVWYHDPAKDVTKTIIGEVPVAPVEPTAASPLPKNLSNKAAVEAAKKIVVPQAALDKRSVGFILGKEATEQVTFHNSSSGVVQVSAEVRGVRDTVSVEPNSMMVNPQGDVPFKITYKPRPESSVQGGVLFTLEPFGSVYVLPVRLTREGQIRRSGAPAVPGDATPSSAVPAPAAPAPAAPAPAPTAPAPGVPQ
jgi:hypothetical protein